MEARGPFKISLSLSESYRLNGFGMQLFMLLIQPRTITKQPLMPLQKLFIKSN